MKRENTHKRRHVQEQYHSVAFCVWQGSKTASALIQCKFEQIKLAVRSQAHSKPHRPRAVRKTLGKIRHASGLTYFIT